MCVSLTLGSLYSHQAGNKLARSHNEEWECRLRWVPVSVTLLPVPHQCTNDRALSNGANASEIRYISLGVIHEWEHIVLLCCVNRWSWSLSSDSIMSTTKMYKTVVSVYYANALPLLIDDIYSLGSIGYELTWRPTIIVSTITALQLPPRPMAKSPRRSSSARMVALVEARPPFS